MLTAGYFQTTYWAEDYWNDRYWQDYGTAGWSGKMYGQTVSKIYGQVTSGLSKVMGVS